MKLYVYAHAPYARKVMVAVFERALTLDTEIVPPWDAALLKQMREIERQPLATVPLLRRDDGSLLSDSSMIVEYLDRIAPGGPKLVPAAVKESFEVRAHDRFAEQLLVPSVYLTWSHQIPVEKRNLKKIGMNQEKFARALEELDRRLEGKTFVHGDAFTLADIGPSCAIADSCGYWPKPIDLDPYANVKRWYHAVQARDSWQKVHAAAKIQVAPF